MTSGPAAVDPTRGVGLDLAGVPVALAHVRGGVIEYATEGFVAIVGASAEELSGRRLLDLFAPEERLELAGLLVDTESPSSTLPAGHLHDLGGLAVDGVPFLVDVRVGRRDAADGVWVALEGVGPPVIGPEDPAVDYVRTSNWQILGLDRVLSHDLRAALRGTTSFLSLLDREMGADAGEHASEYLATAASAASRADEMVDRLVRLLRLSIRPLRVSRVSVGESVSDAVALSLSEFEGDPPILTLDPFPDALADRGLVVDCLAELLTNARKFADGPVAVRVAGESRDGWLYLRISDDGPGVEAEFVDDVFKPFRLLQAKGRYPGVGLGLTTCREIARVHGGRCWIDPGADGTTVIVRLPAAT